MEIRKVTPEEKLYIQAMQSLAFNIGLDEKETRERIKKEDASDNTTYGAIDENGRVSAGIDAIPFTMWFDGNKVPMTGIGGVVSAPEDRRGGNIRKIFRKIIDEAYEAGVVFSHLYPFSHDYYRKFGYEHVGAAIRYKLPVAPARKLRQTGRIAEFISSTAQPELCQKIKSVYEGFASRHNLMVSRNEKNWEEILKITLFGNDRLYYWLDGTGQIKAWVKFDKTKDTLNVKDIAWLDNESMLGIIQFLGVYEGNVEKIAMTASPEFIAELYWPNLYDITAERMQWNGMNRIINVRTALELMKKPAGSGKFTLKVDDDFLPQNNGTFLVEYENGKSSVTTTQAEPDIELTERALTQLVLGVYEPAATLSRDDIKLNCDPAALFTLFPKKNLLIKNYF